MADPTSPIGVPPTEPGQYLARAHGDEHWRLLHVVRPGRRLVVVTCNDPDDADVYDYEEVGDFTWGPSLSSLLEAAARVPELEAERDAVMRRFAEHLVDASGVVAGLPQYRDSTVRGCAESLFGVVQAARLFPSPPTEEGPTQP